MRRLPTPETPVLLLRFTAFRTRLSSGLRLGSLVDERMPVPQLLASVFLAGGQEGGQREAAGWRGRTGTGSPPACPASP